MNTQFFKDQNIRITPQAELKHYTTFQLGGPCSYLIECQKPEDLIASIQHCHQNNIPFILIGGGSNIVVSDQGIETCVIRYYSEKLHISQQGHEITVAASSLLDDLAQYAANNGLEGLNYTTGIPGTIGGAIVGNAGAFGKQIGDVLQCVTLVKPDGQIHIAYPQELGFTYRHSQLKTSDMLVVSATFILKQGHQEDLLKEREEILALRASKHPNLKQHPCAGSFFKNIEPTSSAGKRQAAGWFLDEAGGKNLISGGAKIFDKHANIIIKSDGCQSQDVFNLSEQMKHIVKEKFDLDLKREVRFVGPFNNAQETCNPLGFW